MHDFDVIALAAFDDPPEIRPAAVPGPRPANRPRPGPSGQPHAEPITLVVVDSDAGSEPAIAGEPGRGRPKLAVDIGVLDPTTTSFVMVYAAGTSLDALGPRTVAIPMGAPGSPINRLELCVRKPTEPAPARFLTFECPQDIRGRQLTLRFSDPTDLRSLVVQCDVPPEARESGDDGAVTEAGAGDYTDEEILFMKAMDQYKRDNRQPFPTWSEILRVLRALGYRRVAEPTTYPAAPSRSTHAPTTACPVD
jgi:hypothetical protein